MFIRKSRGKYYQIVKAIRVDGKAKHKVLYHLGTLSNTEFLQIKAVLKAKDTEKLTVINKFLLTRNEAFLGQTVAPKTKVMEEVLVNPYRDGIKQTKFEIDKEWLKKMYLEEKYSILQIAKMCDVNKSVVRRNLLQSGIVTQEQIDAQTKDKKLVQEFGWDIINGKRVQNPYEQKMIEAILFWRNKENLSFDKIAQKLTEMKVPGKLGSAKWDRGHVRRLILKSSKMA